MGDGGFSSCLSYSFLLPLASRWCRPPDTVETHNWWIVRETSRDRESVSMGDAGRDDKKGEREKQGASRWKTGIWAGESWAVINEGKPHWRIHTRWRRYKSTFPGKWHFRGASGRGRGAVKETTRRYGRKKVRPGMTRFIGEITASDRSLLWTLQLSATPGPPETSHQDISPCVQLHTFLLRAISHTALPSS